MAAVKTPKHLTFGNEEEFEKAVLERLSKVLPAAVHDAVHACITTAQADSERRTQNGIREPKRGGKCHVVWTKLDSMRSAGMEPNLQEVTAMSQAEGWNVNNTRIEYYNWKRFHGYGVRGRRVERRKVDRRVKMGKPPRGMKERRARNRRDFATQ